jgi:hypothetical protein
MSQTTLGGRRKADMSADIAACQLKATTRYGARAVEAISRLISNRALDKIVRRSIGGKMNNSKTVLVVGLDPNRKIFLPPAWAVAVGWTAEKIASALETDCQRLEALGYQVEMCLSDFGDSTVGLVEEKLKVQEYACVCIGAGIRTDPKRFTLFENLINLIHAQASNAKICFNKDPADTAEAIQRWL